MEFEADYDDQEQDVDHQDGGDGGGGNAFEFAPVDEDMQALEARLRTSKDGLVFLVDCREGMFGGGGGKSAWSLAISIISRVLRRKIIVQAKTQCSILFWGTREKQNENGFDSVYEFMHFDLPSAGKISQLDAFLAQPDQFEQTIGRQQSQTPPGSCFEQALWLTSSLFAANKYTSRDEQRVWVFTNDADLGQQDKHKVLMRLEDLRKSSASVTLWTLTANKHEFDLKLYWNEVMGISSTSTGEAAEDEDDDSGVVWVAQEADLTQVLDLTRKREFAKRTLVSLPLVLGANVEIGVKMYAIVLETKLPYAVALEERTGKPVKISTRWLCQSTAKHVSPDQILTTARYGALGSIALSTEDKKRIKRFAPASLTILGFKPMEELKPWQNVRAPYLIRADGKAVKNSARALLSLVGEVLAQRKFAVARLIANKSAAPKLVALLPQAEVLDQDGDVVSPLGFLVVVLPYADDIREPSFPQVPRRSTKAEQIDLAKLLLGKLQCTKPFDPRDYENPALQKFWHSLEALALDQRDSAAATWKESENDLLRLANEDDLVFDEEFAETSQAFVDSYCDGKEDVVMAPVKRCTAAAGTKRARAAPAAGSDDDDEDGGGGGGGRSKRQASASAAARSYDDFNWAALADAVDDSDGLARLKNDELKLYLAHHGLSKSGTKAVMISRIRDHLEAN